MSARHRQPLARGSRPWCLVGHIKVVGEDSDHVVTDRYPLVRRCCAHSLVQFLRRAAAKQRSGAFTSPSHGLSVVHDDNGYNQFDVDGVSPTAVGDLGRGLAINKSHCRDLIAAVTEMRSTSTADTSHQNHLLGQFGGNIRVSEGYRCLYGALVESERG